MKTTDKAAAVFPQTARTKYDGVRNFTSMKDNSSLEMQESEGDSNGKNI